MELILACDMAKPPLMCAASYVQHQGSGDVSVESGQQQDGVPEV